MSKTEAVRKLISRNIKERTSLRAVELPSYARSVVQQKMFEWLFQSDRIHGFPSIYPENKTAVTVDVVEVIIIFVTVITAISYFLIIPGYGKKRSVHIIVKTTLSILIGGSILIGNYGQEWEVGEIMSITPYRAADKNEINAHIKVKIGLRSVNITLRRYGKSEDFNSGEIIDYNERFLWTWDQGRFGFGPNSGHLQMSLRDGQRRGLPLPILWIVDYFVIDGEGIRFGRFYRTAGWYCHILMWTSFPMWILANIFLQSVGRFAAYCLALIGCLEVLCCIIWILIHNPTPSIIPFQEHGIVTSYGSTFWITCTGGILCLILASIILLMDLRFPNTLSEFLGVDILDQYDECVIRANDLNCMTNTNKKNDVIELERMSEQLAVDDSSGLVLLKRRSAAKRAQKNRFRVSSVSLKIHNCDNDTPVYANQLPPTISSSRVTEINRKPSVPRRNQYN